MVFVSALPSVILDPPLIGERYTVEQGRRADLLCERNDQDYPLPNNITINGSKYFSFISFWFMKCGVPACRIVLGLIL